MPYNPTTWVNDQTPLSAGNLNKIEQGIKAAHDAIDDLPNKANTWAAKQVFSAGAQLGDANADLIDVFGLLVPLGTHTKQVTAWDSTFPAKPRTIQIKDGSTVLATIEVTERNSEGKVTQLKITQGARTRTWNITWTAGREFPDSISVS